MYLGILFVVAQIHFPKKKKHPTKLYQLIILFSLIIISFIVLITSVELPQPRSNFANTFTKMFV